MAIKLSLNWLSDYLEGLTPDVDLITAKLPFIGYEIDGVEKIAKTFANMVIGKVESKEKHPDADKLAVCKVNVGKEESLQIVCGAPNVAAGQTVCVALEGADFGDFKIKKTKLRGVDSCGMICSAKELDLSDDHNGIMVMDDKYPAGTPLYDLFGMEDTVLEVDVTANRPDMYGYFGFAREFGLFMPVTPKFPVPVFKENSENIKDFVSIDIQDSKACPRYSARLVKNVKIQESPDWLKQKLLAVGLRPINNVVDVTNFVMLETGHPLHAFDFNQLTGHKIVVRKAVNGEKFITLDNSEYTLNDEIVLICDGEKPVALGGVMGGLNSGVTTETRDILLEVAYFNFVDIRHATKNLNLSTDSAKRFERGVDPNDAEYVINRAASLLEQLAEGEIVGGIYDVYPNKIEPLEIRLRAEKVNTLLGLTLSNEEIATSLEKVNLKLKSIENGVWLVTVPTCRPDIKIEMDLIEEVIRVYGYDKLPEITRSCMELENRSDAEELFLDTLRQQTAALGLMEINSTSMIDGKYTTPFSGQPVKIQHPLNEEMNHLRNSLLVSLLQTTGRNMRRAYPRIAIFEAGKKFSLAAYNAILEENCLAGVLAGTNRRQQWNEPEIAYDFYDIKGLVEEFLAVRHCYGYQFDTENLPAYLDADTALSVWQNGIFLGAFGLVSSKTQKVFDIEAPVYAFEFSVPALKKAENTVLNIQDPSKYPKVLKDLSFLMNENQTAGEVLAAIKKYGGKNLQAVEVIDFYKGKQVEDGKKSYSFRLTFQSFSATLSDNEIEKLFQKVINGTIRDLQISLR